jgi:hypothetical protein
LKRKSIQTQVISPTHPLFCKLSRVKILLFKVIHKNNLYLGEILRFQTDLDKLILIPPKLKKNVKRLNRIGARRVP